MGCACIRPSISNNIIVKEESSEINNINEKFNDKIEFDGNENELFGTDIKILKNSKLKNLNKNENIKNFTEKIEQSNDYEIIPIDKLNSLISPEALNSLKYYENNQEKFENNNFYEKNTVPNSFKMPPIKNKSTEEIYEGNYIYDKEKDNFSKIGEGKLITKDKEIILFNVNENSLNYENAKFFYNNGDIFIGDFSKNYPYEKEKGTLFYKDKNNDFSSFLQSNDFKTNPIKIKKVFPNKDEYEGDAILNDNLIILEGNGKYKRKSDNSIYEGEFKNNQFNGKGNLFIPLQNSNESDQGKLIITNWINGIENGKGIIKTKNENNEIKEINCIFRFGKVINVIQKSSKKIKLHKNILNFLSPNEIYIIAKNTKIKSMLEYLKEDNFKNLNNIKFFSIINNTNNSTNKSNTIRLQKIYDLKITNIGEIIKNYKENKILFIPIQAYKTNGGQVENRYRYQNIFNPIPTKIYTTHYILNKCKDVSINGVINYKMFNNNKTNQISISNKNSNINENELSLINEIIKIQEKYINSFEDVDKNYPECDKYRDVLDHRKIILNESIIGNVSKCLFSIHYISIFIPTKYNDLSFVTLPCHFLSVYIHEDDDLISEECSINICQQIIKENNNNIEEINNKFSKDILLMEKKEHFSYIEFDTITQPEKSKKILCLIEINHLNPDKNPYIITLNKYYHFGRYITIKLIDQNSLYNTMNRNCIDFGTINFYGDVFEL